MKILPHPQKINISEEKYKTKDTFCVNFPKTDEFNRIKKYMGTFLNIKEGESEDISFIKDLSLKKSEEHIIRISENKTKIFYATEEAAFRAVSSLKQIFSQAKDGFVNQCEIYDFADIPVRGIMLDVSRGKLPKMSSIYEIVDLMANLKYNHLELYFDTFVFEYSKFPEYCKDTMAITASEIKELEKYCKERFIELVPNQNGFGHMKSWIDKEELHHLGIVLEDGSTLNTLNPFKEESLELVDKIYSCLLPYFESEYVNVGLDEPFELGKGDTKEACEKAGGIGKVYVDYVKKINDIVNKNYNKKIMFWADIVFKHPEYIKELPKNVTFLEWGYETEHKFERHCKRLSELGFDFYVCPGTSSWGSVTGRTDNMIFNIQNAAQAGKKHGAKGFLLTDWQQNDGQSYIISYIPFVYGASYAWNGGFEDVEEEYMRRDSVITDTLYYVDKEILEVTSEKSLADIIYRMGNYYLLEERHIFNNTMTFIYGRKMEKLYQLPYEKLNPVCVKNVRNYMKNISEELENEEFECKNKEIVLRKLKLLCGIVICICAYIEAELKKETDKKYILNRFEALKKEYSELWLINNKAVNNGKFFDKFKMFLSE